MSSGSPWSQSTFYSRNWAVVLADGRWLQGIKWAILARQSTTIKITVCPSDIGSSTMKSRLMVDQGLAGVSVWMGTKLLRGLVWDVLICAKHSQESMYVWTLAHMQGHLKKWATMWEVFWWPK